MPKGFDWLWFCLHGTLLPAGGEGGRRKRKEPHDGKKSSHTDYTETHADFCIHAALGRLRFVSGSTAQLLYLVVFSISGTGVRVKTPNEKSVRVHAKFSEKQAWDCDLREQQAQQVYVHLQKNGACHTGKMAFQQTARNAIFLFWGHPKPSIIKDCYFFAYSGLILFVFAIIIIMWIYTDGKMQSRLYELGDTPMKYLSVTQTAEKWGISTRRIQILCNGNRIPGAIKIGNQWAIPDNESKPADARIKSGKYIKNADEHGVR